MPLDGPPEQINVRNIELHIDYLIDKLIKKCEQKIRAVENDPNPDQSKLLKYRKIFSEIKQEIDQINNLKERVRDLKENLNIEEKRPSADTTRSSVMKRQLLKLREELMNRYMAVQVKYASLMI